MNILEMDLSEKDTELLTKSLENWKEEVYSNLLEEVEELKESKIEELEEANLAYREEVKAEYADKLIEAINEMRDDLRAEVVSELVDSNPELKILEKVKEVVAPLLNEDFVGNIYAEEIMNLKEEVEYLREEKELEEGATALAELLSPLSEQTQNLILAVIKEGNEEEVTEQFYNIIESLNILDEDDDDDDDDDEDDDEDDKKKKKKKDDDDEDEDDEDEDDEEETDEEFDPYTDEDEEVAIVNENALKNRMKNLIG